jgi:hypothetical protein
MPIRNSRWLPPQVIVLTQDHTFMYSLALIIFEVSEKKAFEHYPIESNVNLCPTVAAILDYHMGKIEKYVLL